MYNENFNYRQAILLEQTPLTAYMNSEDIHYMKASSLFLDLVDLDRYLVTTNYTIFDTYEWLRNQSGFDQAGTFLNNIDNAVGLGKLEIITGNSQYEQEARQLLKERPEYHFSLNEAVNAIIMMTYQMKNIFTFNPNYIMLKKLNPEIKLIPSVS